MFSRPSPTTPRTTQRRVGFTRQGFTLIELLVVIAIISILASMLFPSFSRARESARRTDCLSNQKQVGTGLYMYTQDYDERYPIGCPFWFTDGSNVPHQPQISKVLLTYIGGNYQVWNCKSWTGVYIPDSEEGNYSFLTAEDSPAANPNNMLGVPDPSGGGLLLTPRKEAALNNASEYPLLFCGAGPQQVPDLFHGHTLMSDAQWAAGAISGTNVLYGDTHVKWWKGTRGGWDNLYNTPLR